MTAYELRTGTLDSDISDPVQLAFDNSLDPTDSGFPNGGADHGVIEKKATASTYSGSYSSEEDQRTGLHDQEGQQQQRRHQDGGDANSRVFYDDQGNHFYSNESTFFEEDTHFYELSQASGQQHGSGSHQYSSQDDTRDDTHTTNESSYGTTTNYSSTNGSTEYSTSHGTEFSSSQQRTQASSHQHSASHTSGSRTNDDWATSSVGSATYGSRTHQTDLDGLSFLEEEEEEHDDDRHAERSRMSHTTHTYTTATQTTGDTTTTSASHQQYSASQPDSAVYTTQLQSRASNHSASNHHRPTVGFHTNSSSPLQSVASNGSVSSWEPETTRNASLLDDDDTDDGETYADGTTLGGDDQTYFSYDSDDSTEMNVRETFREVVKSFKNGDCNFGGVIGSNGYDDDEDDDEETYVDFPYTPSGGLRSVRSTTSYRSSRSRRSMSGNRSTTSRTSRRSTSSRRRRGGEASTTQALFDKVSALGEEFMQLQLSGSSRSSRDNESRHSSSRGSRGGSSRRSSGGGRSKERPMNIMESFQDIFSCGTRNY